MSFHFRSFSESTANQTNEINQLSPIQLSERSSLIIHSDSQQSLDRLFNPALQPPSAVPLRQRNLPSSFFNPGSNVSLNQADAAVAAAPVVQQPNHHYRNYSSPAFMPNQQQRQPDNNSLHFPQQISATRWQQQPSQPTQHPQSVAAPSGIAAVPNQIQQSDPVPNHHYRNFSSPTFVPNQQQQLEPQQTQPDSSSLLIQQQPINNNNNNNSLHSHQQINGTRSSQWTQQPQPDNSSLLFHQQPVNNSNTSQSHQQVNGARPAQWTQQSQPSQPQQQQVVYYRQPTNQPLIIKEEPFLASEYSPPTNGPQQYICNIQYS